MLLIGSRMFLSVYWLLLINLAVDIGAETVYSYGAQRGSEPGALTKAAQTPLRNDFLLQAVSCGGVNGQEPCFEMAPPSDGGDLSFQAGSHNPTSFSGTISQESGQETMQLGDAYGSPVSASPLNPSPSFHGSNLVQNFLHVVPNENVDSNTPHVGSYGSVYRLLKPNNPYSNNREIPFASYTPPISSSVPSMSDQNGYSAGFSHLDYDATQQGDASNSAAYHSINKPSQSGMMISSGPMVTFVMPSPSPEPLVGPTRETPEPTALPHEDCQFLGSLNKPTTAPKLYLARKLPQAPELEIIKPQFTHMENAYSSADTNDQSSRASQSTDLQTTATSFRLSLNPYFMAKQHGSSHSMLKPLQPKYFPASCEKIRNLMSSGQGETSKGFKFGHLYGSVMASDHVQTSYGAQTPASQPLESVQSRPYESKNLFDYLVSLPLQSEQFIHANHNQLQTGQSESADLTNPTWGNYSPAPLLGSDGL